MARGRRRYPKRPILGVGAIILKRDRVLLVERAKSPLKGYWSLPGGVLETGEQLQEGIRREVLEETGLVVEPLRVVTIFERIMRDGEGKPEYHYVLIDYLCRPIGGVLQAGSDVSEVALASLSGLGEFRLRPEAIALVTRGLEEAPAVFGDGVPT